MEAPEKRHVRIWRDEIYIERVPNAWVMVCQKADWDTYDEPARHYMIAKALKTALDFSLPKHTETSDLSE